MFQGATPLAVVQLPQASHNQLVASREVNLVGEVDVGIADLTTVFQDVEEKRVFLLLRCRTLYDLLPERLEIVVRLRRVRFRYCALLVFD